MTGRPLTRRRVLRTATAAGRDEGVITWRKEGGDEIRAECETAYQAAG